MVLSPSLPCLSLTPFLSVSSPPTPRLLSTCFAFNSSVLGSLTAPCSSGSARAGIFTDISLLFFPYSRTPPSTLVTHQAGGCGRYSVGAFKPKSPPLKSLLKVITERSSISWPTKANFAVQICRFCYTKPNIFCPSLFPPSPGQCHTHFDDGTHREQNVGWSPYQSDRSK